MKKTVLLSTLLLSTVLILTGCNSKKEAIVPSSEESTVKVATENSETTKTVSSEEVAKSEDISSEDKASEEPASEEKPSETVEEAETSENAEPATPQSISATVSGTHHVGDALSPSDFTITITMSDGSTIKNPAGWNATPLTLDSENTVITVTYNGLSTTVTVNAGQPAAQQPVPEQGASDGEPSASSNVWPESAYGPVTDAAVEDCYNYAVAHGWTAVTGYSDAFGGGWSTYYEKNGQGFSVFLGYFCINSTFRMPGEFSMIDVYKYIDSI